MRPELIKAFTPSIEAWRHGGMAAGVVSFIEKA
jgi:hypothetical protein